MWNLISFGGGGAVPSPSNKPARRRMPWRSNISQDGKNAIKSLYRALGTVLESLTRLHVCTGLDAAREITNLSLGKK